MSSIQEALHQQQLEATYAEAARKKAHAPVMNALRQPVTNDQFASAAPSESGHGVRLTSAAPLPTEKKPEVARDNGAAAGQTMLALGDVQSVGGLALAAEKLDVGYHTTQRTTQKTDETVQSKDNKEMAKEDEAKAKDVARHMLEAHLIAACPLVGIIATVVMEKHAATSSSSSNGESEHQRQQAQVKDAWSANSNNQPGVNTQGVVTTTNPDDPTTTNTPQQSHVALGTHMQRPAANSHEENILVQRGAQHLANAGTVLAQTMPPHKAGLYSGY